MPLSPLVSTLLRARGRRSRTLLGTALLAVAAMACECGGPGTIGAGPDIEVNPSAITVAGVPSRFTEVIVEVSNVGNGTLTFGKAPSFIESDGDEIAEFAVVGKFAETCDGQDRPLELRNDIAAGGCARLVFRYLPHGDGLDAAVLRFESNDDNDPILDVPINASAQTPDIEVCAFNGEEAIGCAIPGALFEVDFGTVATGDAATRTLRLRSLGSRPVDVFGAAITGPPEYPDHLDYAVAPDPYAQAIAANAQDTLTLTFKPVAGAGRSALLTLTTNDPDESTIGIVLVGQGDGPRLCVGVGEGTGRCTIEPPVLFGRVPSNGTAHRHLCLVSCGTKPLRLDNVELVDATGAFAITAPAVPVTPAANTQLEVPITFHPPTADRFTARINLVTETEHIFVNLEGEGFESGCKLESASNTLDFGQAAVGYESKRDYTVANRGTADCLIPQAPVISVGADVKFALAGFPQQAIVAPGAVVKFVVGYTPLDVTGPDLGELLVRYADATPGAPVSELKVALKGSPTAVPKCILVAEPSSGSRFGRTLNFGQVRVNTEKVLPVTFTNTGSIACTINPGAIRGTSLPGTPNDAGSFKVKTQAITPLQPGQSTILEVGFTPTGNREYGSALPGFPGGNAFGVNLTVNTSDTVTFDGSSCDALMGSGPPGCVSWALSGRGARSDLAVLPPDVNFGLITLGCRSREQVVTLYNVGTIPINITELRVDPAPPPEIFKLLAPPVPFTLAGGGQQQFTVRYRPPDANIHTATVYIKSDATNVSGANPYVTVSLKGTGTTESHQTDTFDQNSRPKTDVLFVVDDSGSMSEEQSALANNASRFVNVATQLNTDFQIGVVTTDVDNDCGALRGNPKIILPGPNAASQFSATIRALGTNGSGDERGFEAMVCALTDPLINDPAKNKGFLRLDAKLAVVIISDEEDSSNGTLDFYTDFLKNLKGIHNQSLVSLSAIVGDPGGGCSSNNGDATAGERYITVQQRTNGKYRSICTSDWGQIAADLGLDAFGARAGFPLSRLADPATIHVKVNGAVATQWTYDANANAVVFAQSATPLAGATVVIDYETLCL